MNQKRHRENRARSYCVMGCSYSKEDLKEISFHRFPKDPLLLNAWLKACKIECWTPTQRDSLCCKHFENKYLDRKPNTRNYLRRQAIPSIFNGIPDRKTVRLQQEMLKKNIHNLFLGDGNIATMPPNEQIIQLKHQIEILKKQLAEKEIQLATLTDSIEEKTTHETTIENKLTKYEIERYSRQLIMPEVGVAGQLKLRASKILIVGVGGLGCPAAQYLCGAGVGTIGLLDYDEVELHNLHRQLLHSESSIGRPKTETAFNALSKLNSHTIIHTYKLELSSRIALDIIKDYDIILDATDNVATKYLLNDACVLLDKPLVAGSALQMEGQLTVYNYSNGPCYRCIFPIPPPPEAVTNCGDGGVIGAVPGVIGTLQALEAIKIILKLNGVLYGRLVVFDGSNGVFRTVLLRNKRIDCAICSEMPTITELIDYEQFCNMRATDKDSALTILDDCDRITVAEYSGILNGAVPHTLIDVRNPNEYQMCNIPSSINIPIKTILNQECTESDIERMSQHPVFVICRRGNDSQLAVKQLQKIIGERQQTKDIIGGLHAWSSNVDPSFPIY